MQSGIYFAIDVAIFGLHGLTPKVRVFGMMTKSISSIGMAQVKPDHP